MMSYCGFANVLAGDGKLLPIPYIGNISRITRYHPLALECILHVHELKHNFLSVHLLCWDNIIMFSLLILLFLSRMTS